jgi:Domain of unknown function (DUF222)
MDMCTTAGALEKIRTGMAELAAMQVVDLPDQQVRDQLLELLSVVNAGHALIATRADSFDRRGLADLDGFRTLRSWLIGFGRLAPAAAIGIGKRTRLLAALPAMRQAALGGAVSVEHLDKLHCLAEQVGGVDPMVEFDEVLAQLSSAANPAQTQKACERIAAYLKPDGPVPDPEADFERRELTLSRCGTTTYLRGRFDAEGGAALYAALDALMRPPTGDDDRSAGQRRADAMVHLARGALAHGPLPTVGGNRPQIGLLISPEALTGYTGATDPVDGHGHGHSSDDEGGQGNGDGGGAGIFAARDPLAGTGVAPETDQPWLNWVGAIPNSVAQRLACDCEIFRLVLDPASGMPLDVGDKPTRHRSTRAEQKNPRRNLAAGVAPSAHRAGRGTRTIVRPSPVSGPVRCEHGHHRHRQHERVPPQRWRQYVPPPGEIVRGHDVGQRPDAQAGVRQADHRQAARVGAQQHRHQHTRGEEDEHAAHGVPEVFRPAPLISEEQGLAHRAHPDALDEQAVAGADREPQQRPSHDERAAAQHRPPFDPAEEQRRRQHDRVTPRRWLAEDLVVRGGTARAPDPHTEE